MNTAVKLFKHMNQLPEKTQDLIYKSVLEVYPVKMKTKTDNFSLDTCPQVSTDNNIPNVKEEKMSDCLTAAQGHLVDRARSIRSDKGQALYATFHITDDTPPHTPQELVDRIKAGKFILPSEDTLKMNPYLRPTDLITWRDPAVPADKAGYTAAKEALAVQYTNTKDTIYVKTADEGLAAVQAFEAWQPTAATTTAQ